MGSGAVLHRPHLLQRQGSGAAVSRRHVLRLLSRRTEPGQAARRSRRIRSGKTSTPTPGAQYFWVDRIFFWDARTRASFVYQLFHTSRPGTLDTSFISTDNINNPRTMNAVYSVGARLGSARRWGKEKLAGGG